MTAHARLLQLRRSLAITLAARALLIGGTVTIVVLAVARVLVLPSWSTMVAVLAGSGVAAMHLLRLRALQSLSRVALWVEEHTPSLRYSLVTIADGVQSPSLETQALGVPWWSDALRTLLRSLLVPALAAVLALGFWSLAPQTGFTERLASSRAGKTSALDVLAIVHVAVVPPGYSGRVASSADDPTSIEALVGSAIILSGNGDVRLVTAAVDSGARSVAPRGRGWSLSLVMPLKPSMVRLHSAAGHDRLVVLAPIPDAAPSVTLLLPAHDTIVRRATGSLVLHAQLRDDIGLRDAAFELVVSSGGGENFTFRTATIGHAVLNGRTEVTLDARIRLDSLALEPGDILQMRAVARDGNTVTGPGEGASETRALRVARTGEYDSVAVEAALPPEAETQLLSQRMLMTLTEALVRRQGSLTRAVLVNEAQNIALEQRKLRKRVGDVVFQRMGSDPLSEEGSESVASRGKLSPEQLLRLADSVSGTTGNVMDVEGDETPILAINKPLLEAFNAMWDAGRALEVAEPANALPPMRRALAAIERARQAERIYLRGRPNTQIVDVATVRLAGKDKGTTSVREQRATLEPAIRRRAAAFERVTALLARDPDAAADSLLVMRVEALSDAPVLAAALDAAARALRKRDNATIPLAWARVRRTLGSPPAQRAGVSAWQSAP